MKLISETTTTIPVGQMQDGEIAIVTKWSNCDGYIGDIVQRYADYLLVVGKPSGKGWGRMFNDPSKAFMDNGECMVRILPKGTVIEID